ncbi:MAG: sulfatase [Flavobacteriaceae bacterium]
MKYLSLLFLTLSGIFFISCKEENPLEEEMKNQPNVVYINVDDLGWKDLGFMDGGFFETPYIDRFSKQAMMFTNSYASAANCAPSRACLMSGQYTPRHGIYTVSPSARGKASTRKLIPIKNVDSLMSEVLTLAEMFKMVGYSTGTFGKWHLGSNPLQQGFDVNVGGSLRGNPGKDGYFSPYKISNIENGPEGEHLTDRLTQEAIQFLRKNKEVPFFLYLPFYSVHTPIMAKENLVKKYKAKTENPLGIDPTYAAMVETMDTNVGKLLNTLDSLGLTKNTIVVITSDNGGIRSIAPQDPLRAGKGSYYEGGTRVPCIIRWPGVVEPGTQSDQPIINIDFFPTFKELLGIELQGKVLDGKSILPILKGNTIRPRPLFWHFPIYLRSYNKAKDEGRDPLFRTRPGSTILFQGWKLHWYYEDQGIELYYLPEDPGERNNIADKEPEKAQEMLKKLKTWQSEVQAPVPTELNPNYISKN